MGNDTSRYNCICRKFNILSEKNDSWLVRVNDKVSMGEALEVLNGYGYDENIETKNIGEYTRRGGIVDVFPTNTKNPIRIEFDGDDISSIRYFNPRSQLSIDRINGVNIPKLIKDISPTRPLRFMNSCIH